MGTSNRFRRIFAAIAAAAWLACAAGDRHPPGSTTSSRFGWDGVVEIPIANPDGSPPELPPRIVVETLDERTFSQMPRSLRRPSLPTRYADAPAARRRAIGRRRYGRGGPLWLPAGRTVGELAEAAVAVSLWQRDDAATRAGVVEISIESLWAWRRKVRGSMDLFESEWVIRVRGPVPGWEDGFLACGQGRIARDGASVHIWRAALDRGLSDLVADLGARLDAPDHDPPDWRCLPRDGAP